MRGFEGVFNGHDTCSMMPATTVSLSHVRLAGTWTLPIDKAVAHRTCVYGGR